MTRVMSSTTRPFYRDWHHWHPMAVITPGFPGRPCQPGALTLNSLPVGLTEPFNGMDPSDSSTWVRQYNPQPGMVGRLNYDGAKIQGETEMGGLWGLPAHRESLVGQRPSRRPR